MDFITDLPLHFFLFISLYFEVFLMITYIEKRKLISKEETLEPASYLPTVSIIMPVFNEEKTVKDALDSLLDLDYPKEKMKILVVDDGSTDNTLFELEQYKKNEIIEILKKENGGKHTA